MRTFIAIEIPGDIRKRLADYINMLDRLCGNNVKWVKEDNLHFTVKFLGEIEQNDLETVNRCVAETIADIEPFTVGLSDVGFFPSSRNPRVVWIGTDGGEDELLGIYQNLESCLESEGFDRDSKPFSPHLTIGRVKRNGKLVLPGTFVEFEPVKFEVSSLAVIKSSLTPDGPIYEKLSETRMVQDMNVC